MIRLVLGAILLATLLPVRGDAQAIGGLAINAAVFMLFLFYGMRLSRGEVWQGLGNRRLLVPLVFWIFGAMSLAGWALWQGTSPFVPPMLAIGFLYLGVLPSTVQSAAIYCSLAGGNIASSVVAAALVNILGVFISVPLYSLLAGSEDAVFSAQTLLKVLTVLLLPFVLGQALQGVTSQWVARNRKLISWMDRSVIGLGVYIAFSGAVEQGMWSKFDAGVWAVLLLACAALLVFAYGGSWLLGGALKLARGDRIAMLFAGGQKSIAMGAPLAMVMFPPAAAGTLLLPLIIYHLGQMVVAAPIASRLGRSED